MDIQATCFPNAETGGQGITEQTDEEYIALVVYNNDHVADLCSIKHKRKRNDGISCIVYYTSKIYPKQYIFLDIQFCSC